MEHSKTEKKRCKKKGFIIEMPSYLQLELLFKLGNIRLLGLPLV
jgi:hypothetical protein